MFAVVTASGKTKEEVIDRLIEAVKDLATEQAGNFLDADAEAQIWPEQKFVPMADFMKEDF